MGVDVGDANGDGSVDLFMTHLDRQTNTLYTNLGDGGFADSTSASGLASPSLPFTGFGTAFIDYDNDGWLDVAVANGAVFVIESRADAGDPFPFSQSNQLFRNEGGSGFEEVSQRAGPGFTAREVSRGLVVGDLDNDGDPDIVLTNNNGPARLLLNQVGSENPWIGLRLIEINGRDALGAVVTMRLEDGRELTRHVHTDGSYLSARDPRVLFGLGTTGVPEGLEISWADGSRESFGSVPIRAYSTLLQGTGHSR